MRTLAMRPIAAVAAIAVAAPALAAGQEQERRGAEPILADLEAVQVPAYDPSRRGEEGYAQAFMAELEAAQAERAALIRELYDAAPEHERVAELMLERWGILSGDRGRQGELAEELDAILAEPGNPLGTDAAFYKAMTATRGRPGAADEALAAIEDFIARAPGDERGGYLLYAASQFLGDLPDDRRRALLGRVIDEYGGTRYAATAKGALRQQEAVGEPFELTFQDAISGETISVQEDLAGKVVVVDFWATWCGPCVAAMPHMKELYAEYKDRGVEFIGVSLDMPEEQGGLESLKQFVEERDIPWPQYYQGNGWDSEFSASWGINAIPTMFVVDAEGKIRSTEARGRLETLIPELIEERNAAEGSAGSDE